MGKGNNIRNIKKKKNAYLQETYSQPLRRIEETEGESNPIGRPRVSTS